MPQKPETRFENAVVKLLNKVPHTWHFKAQLVARRGIPDRIICCNGVFVAWELKTDDGKASALQVHNLALIDKAHGVARLVTPATLDRHLKELYDISEKGPGPFPIPTIESGTAKSDQPSMEPRG